jgi:uncharacterized protein (TIGR02646 family)
MIELHRPPEPQIIINSMIEWTNALLAAVNCYGDYASIPDDEKKELLKHYRHKDIKMSLFSSSFSKCAFCECHPKEGGNIEIEHFKPKALFPELTFVWTNLLPACRRCNGKKGSHNTEDDPIINPYDCNPENYFEFDLLKIKPKATNPTSEAEQTIRQCGLNETRLIKPRADLLLSLTGFETDLEDALEDLKEADTTLKYERRLSKLRDSIDRINLLTTASEKYSAFCRNFLNNCNAYQQACALID